MKVFRKYSYGFYHMKIITTPVKLEAHKELKVLHLRKIFHNTLIPHLPHVYE